MRGGLRAHELRRPRQALRQRCGAEQKIAPGVARKRPAGVPLAPRGQYVCCGPPRGVVVRLHIVAGGRQSRACGWATPPPACMCRCERTSPKAPPWPQAPHSQMRLPLPTSCTRCWVDLSCCGLGAEQEQDLCGQCRAARKCACRRVARAKFCRPPAPSPTHLPARLDPHRSRASGALLRCTCDAHLPARSATILLRTAQNDRISRLSPTRFGLSIAPHAPDRESGEIATSRPNPVTSLAHLGRWGLEIGAMKIDSALFRLKRRETSQTETLGGTAARRIAV